jgi:serine/threonine-protein kinase
MPPPAKIGRYEILAELGQGAMGTVYKARDPMMDRTVAIKVIRTTGLPPTELQRYKQRFQREAMTAGKMSHPGIVTIYDISEDEAGHPYMVMEFVEGDVLYNQLHPDEKGKLPQRPPLARSLDIGIQIAEALAYAHGRGVMHRDIKPANILVTPEGRAKIADFGVAKLTGTEGTATARVVGTPAYMSPEMCTGGTVDARTDIFSLGAMLYWMTTGEKPFPGDTISAVAFKVVYEQVVPPRQIDPAISAELESILVRCLAKNPNQRYPNAAELAKDLTALKTGSRRKAAVAPGVAARTMALPDLSPAVAAAKAKWNELFPGNWKYLPLGFVALLVVIVVVGLWLRSSSENPEASGHPAAAAVEATAPSSAETLPKAEAPASQREAEAATEKPRQQARQTSPAAPKREIVEESQPAAQPTPPEPAAKPAPEGAQPEPTPAETAPPPAKIQARAAMATLAIECRHNFRQAKLEIFSGGQKIYTGELVGQSRVLARASGVLNATAPIRAGEHTLSVRVTAEREDYRGEITGAFTEGAARTLRIEFGKGSGLAFKGRKLSLSWRE